ncbi:MAG: hypothetical protein JXR35_05390 [Rhodobacteraceae bacterium]|nr:hypothetical protein [Paracoccaceae bacterium]
MFGFVRLAILGFIALSVIFWLVRIYARSLRREALEDEWAEAEAAGDTPGPREIYVEIGMKNYERSLLRKLIWLVYILPIALVVGLIYLVNYA